MVNQNFNDFILYIENFFLMDVITNIYYHFNNNIKFILINNLFNLIISNFTIKSFYFNIDLNSFLNVYLDLYYNLVFKSNQGLLYSNYSIIENINYFYFYFYFYKIIKISFFFFFIYTIFFLTYFLNYIKQLLYINNLTKVFILNEYEKEIGPIDDFFFFIFLFLLTLFSFVFFSIITIYFHSSFFIWILGSLFLISIFILTVPLNLLLDFGILFFVYVRGSSVSNNFLKELLFDIISTTIIFIRFLIQNIRFLFIFLAIFELLEWIFNNNNEFFGSNTFLNYSIFDYFISNKNLNLIIINCLLFTVYYFYYTLHLLFLLLVQIIVYIGISSWLFFFLYSTKFLGKYEKFFTYIK